MRIPLFLALFSLLFASLECIAIDTILSTPQFLALNISHCANATFHRGDTYLPVLPLIDSSLVFVLNQNIDSTQPYTISCAENISLSYTPSFPQSPTPPSCNLEPRSGIYSIFETLSLVATASDSISAIQIQDYEITMNLRTQLGGDISLESSPIYDNTPVRISQVPGVYRYKCAISMHFPDGRVIWNGAPVGERVYDIREECDGTFRIALRGHEIVQRDGVWNVPREALREVQVRAASVFSGERFLNVTRSGMRGDIPLYVTDYSSLASVFENIPTLASQIDAEFLIYGSNCIAANTPTAVRFNIVADVAAPTISVTALQPAEQADTFYGNASLTISCHEMGTALVVWKDSTLTPTLSLQRTHTLTLSTSALISAACNHTTFGFLSPITTKNLTILTQSTPPAPVLSSTRGTFINQPISLDMHCSIAPCKCWYLFVSSSVQNLGEYLPDTSGAGAHNTQLVQDCATGARITHTERGDFVFRAVAESTLSIPNQWQGVSSLAQATFERYENVSAVVLSNGVTMSGATQISPIHTSPVNVTASVQNSPFQATLIAGTITLSEALAFNPSLLDWTAIPINPPASTLILNEALSHDSTLLVRLTPDAYVILGGRPQLLAYQYRFNIPSTPVFPFWWFIIVPASFICFSCTILCVLYCSIGCICASVKTRSEFKRLYMPLTTVQSEVDQFPGGEMVNVSTIEMYTEERDSEADVGDVGSEDSDDDSVLVDV